MPRICDRCFHNYETGNCCPKCRCIDYASYLPSPAVIRALTLEIQSTWTEDEELKRARGSCAVLVKPLQAQVDALRYGRFARLTMRPE